MTSEFHFFIFFFWSGNCLQSSLKLSFVQLEIVDTFKRLFCEDHSSFDFLKHPLRSYDMLRAGPTKWGILSILFFNVVHKYFSHNTFKGTVTLPQFRGL